MKSLVITASAIAMVLLFATTAFAAKPAFALQHFFNCVTEQANKAGGDHNLSLQQVIDCFKKEFPNNPIGHLSLSHQHNTEIIISEHQAHQILNIP